MFLTQGGKPTPETEENPLDKRRRPLSFGSAGKLSPSGALHVNRNKSKRNTDDGWASTSEAGSEERFGSSNKLRRRRSRMRASSGGNVKAPARRGRSYRRRRRRNGAGADGEEGDGYSSGDSMSSSSVTSGASSLLSDDSIVMPWRMGKAPSTDG